MVGVNSFFGGNIGGMFGGANPGGGQFGNLGISQAPQQLPQGQEFQNALPNPQGDPLLARLFGGGGGGGGQNPLLGLLSGLLQQQQGGGGGFGQQAPQQQPQFDLPPRRPNFLGGGFGQQFGQSPFAQRTVFGQAQLPQSDTSPLLGEIDRILNPPQPEVAPEEPAAPAAQPPFNFFPGVGGIGGQRPNFLRGGGRPSRGGRQLER